MSSPHGQDHWPASYPECGSNAQSPINIQTDSVTFDPELPTLQPHGYDQPGTEPLDLHNNGHTVQLSLPPTMYLEGFPRKYVAAQLHLHWGETGSLGGSEHQINSEATAAELHIVHYDSDSYGSLSEAAPMPQGLAVLGILIEASQQPTVTICSVCERLTPNVDLFQTLPFQIRRPQCLPSTWESCSPSDWTSSSATTAHSPLHPATRVCSGQYSTERLRFPWDSWKSFRRHCSPQKRSPQGPWYGTTEPPSLSISGQSLLLSSKWDPYIPQVSRPHPGMKRGRRAPQRGRERLSIYGSSRMNDTFHLPPRRNAESRSGNLGLLSLPSAGCLFHR
ncbi:carbonic anhydrase 14 isoform X3 [Panthera pardus]|uniref:Carbonic anhydrase 14 isoform X3 n=1 Tax=Panthera pardus TaxID=9691 RepID=A0A9W2UHY4_PANPR|nr:carbonic anhydrase 14 isoform X3 [Panthera pardus]